MAKGKREYSRPSAGGVVRNDYHRRNRREHISMFCRSHGRNLPTTSISDYLPRLNLDALIKTAVADAAKRFSLPKELIGVKKACVDYLRHQCSPYENQLRAERKTRHGSQVRAWLSVSEHILKEIAETYPWLADECEHQLNHRRLIASRTRLVKKDEWKRQIVERFNQQHALPKTVTACAVQVEAYTDNDETEDFFRSLNSLDAARFLYLPPFLKRGEVRRRRFGGDVNMNDRWWEWEEELGLKSALGRPIETDYLEMKQPRRQ